MGLIGATRTCLRKYFVFSGRARRPEYWWFVFALFLASIITIGLDAAIFGPEYGLVLTSRTDTSGAQIEGAETVRSYGTGPLHGVLTLVTFIPLVSAGWRRLHDTGRRGYYVICPPFRIVLVGFLALAAVAGYAAVYPGDPSENLVGIAVGVGLVLALVVWPVILFFWLTGPTRPGTNRFGPEPEP